MIAQPEPRRPPARWFLVDVLLPFVVTRAALLWAAWWARQFGSNPQFLYPEIASRGWFYLPNRYLDAFGRCDTGWYLSIALNGYSVRSAPGAVQTDAAFFPLYPVLVRAVHAMVPAAANSPESLYLVALALANALAMAALAIVFVLVRDAPGGDDGLARRAVLYLLVFPAGFFLSCAYSESLFLFLSVGAFLAAQRGRFVAAGAAAALATVTRASGILLVPILALIYLAARDWDARRIRADAVAFLLPFAALAAHAAYLGRLSGDSLAFVHAQAAWGRHLAWPWQTLKIKGNPFVGQIDRIAIAAFIGASAALAIQRRWTWALYTALSLLPILLSGTPMSATRILSVVFPAFVTLAVLARSERAQLAVALPCFAMQILLFVNWVRFDWAG